MSINSNEPETRKKDSIIEKMRGYLFGDDIFISYSRVDSTYALALANKLQAKPNNLSCFLDQWGTPPGEKLPDELINAIKKCSTMVLIGSKNAADSENVGLEVKEFLETSRPIIPITFVADEVISDIPEDFNKQNLIGTLEQSKWYSQITGIAKTTEVLSALQTRTPSENVILRIVNSVEFRSRNKRLRKNFFITLGGVIGLILLALFVVNGARSEAEAANEKSRKAETNANAAVQKQQKAESELLNANQQLSGTIKNLNEANSKLENANTELKNAETKITKAETQLTKSRQELATAESETEKAQNEANEQTKIAEEKRKEAEKQKAIADVRQLSNESSFALSQNNPKLLKQSLENAVEANRIAEENRLNLIEPILSLRKVLSVTPERTDKLFPSKKPPFPLSKPLAECEKFAFSTNYQSFACLSDSLVEVFEIFDITKKPKKIDFSEDLKGTDISYEPANLSVSDDGNTVALAMKKITNEEDDFRKNCHPASNCWIVVRNIDKNPCDGKPCIKMTYDVNNIYLSPEGDFLVFSGIGSDIDGDDENRLTFWNINSSSEPKDLVVRSSSLKGSFSPNGRAFAMAGRNGLDTLVQIFLFGINDRQYSMTERTININYDEVKDIAVSDFGENIALQANGISIWQFDSGKLKALIPIDGEGHISALFTEMKDKNEIVIFNYPCRKNEKKEINLGRQTWSIVGNEGEKVCEDECDKILYGFSPEDVILLMPENQSLIAKTEGTILIISDKSNNKEIDRIDVGETIEKFGFLENENEVITVGYEHSEGLENRYTRKVRKWKIGFQNLKDIADEKIKQLKDIK